MWPFDIGGAKPSEVQAAAAVQVAERQAARVARADVAARVGIDTVAGTYLRGHEHYNELPRSVNQLYAMIDALEKRVRELESRSSAG